MAAVPLLKLMATIPPGAWDAIIPHGPAFHSHGGLASHHAQALPPKYAFAVGAAEMAHELVRIAVETEVRGESAAVFVKAFIDDWCGTPWPHKWPWPWPWPRWKDGPHPEPWEVNTARIIGATVLASAGGRLGDTKLASALVNGAESLAAAAIGAR
jgi:hypothetical protein